MSHLLKPLKKETKISLSIVAELWTFDAELSWNCISLEKKTIFKICTKPGSCFWFVMFSTNQKNDKSI